MAAGHEECIIDWIPPSDWQIRGSCSPLSMSTTRAPRTRIFIVTKRGCSPTTSPIMAFASARLALLRCKPPKTLVTGPLGKYLQSKNLLPKRKPISSLLTLHENRPLTTQSLTAVASRSLAYRKQASCIPVRSVSRMRLRSHGGDDKFPVVDVGLLFRYEPVVAGSVLREWWPASWGTHFR